VELDIRPATEGLWPDVVEAFGPRARADSCWCQRFRQADGATNRESLHREIVGSAVPIGLIAYVDGRPVGWTRVVPRHTLPGITGNRALQRLLPGDDDSAWWVTCVNLQREARGHGVGAALLRSAKDHARQFGASVLDGHPVDVSALASRPSASALFTGTTTMFTRAGFQEIGRTYPSRPVMRAVLR
jgi:GNAT superfamily N-acetyltransferase